MRRAAVCGLILLLAMPLPASAEDCPTTPEERQIIDQVLLDLLAGTITAQEAQEQIDALIGEGCYSVPAPD